MGFADKLASPRKQVHVVSLGGIICYSPIVHSFDRPIITNLRRPVLVSRLAALAQADLPTPVEAVNQDAEKRSIQQHGCHNVCQEMQVGRRLQLWQ